MSVSRNAQFKFAIDRGGTFTDIYAKCPNGKIRVMKLLSVDPQNYNDAPTEGIRRILTEESGSCIDENGQINTSKIEWIRMGTTVATNALLERKGEKMALVINKGFKDLLFIGNQARPEIFALNIQTPDILYEKVIEVNCRIVPAQRNRCLLNQNIKKWRSVEGTTKEEIFIINELNIENVTKQLQELKLEGFQSIAVVLAHSYMFHEHELEIGEIANKLGFLNVSLSHQVMPMIRMVPRGFTACADAYLTPHIQKYLRSFASGFKDNLKDVNVLFMQSDGGLTPMKQFNGSRAILSGPAGGVVGYAVTTYDQNNQQPVIGFDMGGTSTDVSRYAGTFEHVYESTTAGVTIQSPQLDVNTVAAGGGSMLFFRSGLFVVGPESAGAHPGPTCYKKNGPLTVTDANLMLGRLLPQYFPKIFGPNENEPLDKNAALLKFKELSTEINQYLKSENKPEMSVEEVAMGFIRVANETMCRPIRALTQAKGYDTRNHILACFGGAGGQHACAIAKSLGMSTVFVHKYAGILSAYGMALADVVEEAQEPSAFDFTIENFEYFNKRIQYLSNVCIEKLEKQGFTRDLIELEPYLHLRYEGTDCALMCTPKKQGPNSILSFNDFKQVFIDRYQNEFGFILSERNIIVDDIRLRGIGKTSILDEKQLELSQTEPVIEHTTNIFFDTEYKTTNVYLLKNLCNGHSILGPAIIMDNLSTILIEPNCTAVITKYGDIKITIGNEKTQKIGIEWDSIQLSIFSHRFMSIAEQMGRILQRTSISTNIKERLDFSCALFGPDGGLVSNAPHIPVHLGAMQETVQYQLQVFGNEASDGLHNGDVILSNHPKAGGSHLPDLTVITPVFYGDIEKPVFFVASRGHHADIGGITPGSMPPHSTSLSQEGASFKSFKIVDRGVFKEKELIDELMKPGLISGCSGSRNISDNISDLKAQIAANKKGIALVCELIDMYGLNVVQAYMDYIQQNAEIAVRNMLREIGKNTYSKNQTTTLQATDYLDDGSPIQLKINIDIERGSAICDFTGSGYEVWGNCNAPKAITLSALIYCLRCMVGHDVPLNQGCLKPVQVIIPKGSILDPSDDAAVVGGNVQTSQRIVDVVLKAFNVCAASQGCMNNVTFGEDTWGYYETVAGGSGAGPNWHGRGGVHTHMTNTRITDAEILERRYPVILKHFSLRENSGGNGLFKGGDGVIRELIFRRIITISILTERRVFQPYGLEGGENGQRGLNLLIKEDGRIINLGPKNAITAQPGDTFRLLTPGGGGYGQLSDVNKLLIAVEKIGKVFTERGSVLEYRRAQESV